MRLVASFVVCGIAVAPLGALAHSAFASPFVVAPAVADPPSATSLDPAAQTLLDTALAEGEAPRATWDAVIDATLRAHGDVGFLVKALEATTEAATADPQRVFAAHRALVFVLHRDGKIARALDQADKALALKKTHEIEWARARLLDALDRADDAIAAYRALLESSDASERETLGPAHRVARSDAPERGGRRGRGFRWRWRRGPGQRRRRARRHDGRRPGQRPVDLDVFRRAADRSGVRGCRGAVDVRRWPFDHTGAGRRRGPAVRAVHVRIATRSECRVQESRGDRARALAAPARSDALVPAERQWRRALPSRSPIDRVGARGRRVSRCARARVDRAP
jgi:tetratricopeptide (TPR) repeat protein